MAIVGVVARFTVQPDKADEFARVVNEGIVAPSRSEPGCIRYELWRDNADGASFAMVEEWESDAALDAHLAGMGRGEGAPSQGDYLAAPPEMRRFGKTA